MQHSTEPPVSDESAFAEFYQRHMIPLLNFIRRYVPTREDAEDILVDVLFAAYEQRIPVSECWCPPVCLFTHRQTPSRLRYTGFQH